MCAFLIHSLGFEIGKKTIEKTKEKYIQINTFTADAKGFDSNNW